MTEIQNLLELILHIARMYKVSIIEIYFSSKNDIARSKQQFSTTIFHWTERRVKPEINFCSQFYLHVCFCQVYTLSSPFIYNNFNISLRAWETDPVLEINIIAEYPFQFLQLFHKFWVRIYHQIDLVSDNSFIRVW